MDKKKNKGFTLVELIVVIVILAILIGVTIGGIYMYIGKARYNTDKHNLITIAKYLKEMSYIDPVRDDRGNLANEVIIDFGSTRNELGGANLFSLMSSATWASGTRQSKGGEYNSWIIKQLSSDAAPLGGEVVTHPETRNKSIAMGIFPKNPKKGFVFTIYITANGEIDNILTSYCDIFDGKAGHGFATPYFFDSPKVVDAIGRKEYILKDSFWGKNPGELTIV